MSEEDANTQTMGDIQRNKRLRGAVRSATTRLHTRIDHEIAMERPNVDVLEEYLEQLLARERTLIDYDREIEAETEMDHLEDEVNTALEYLDSISERRTRIRRILRRNAEEGENASTVASENSMRRQQSVKLPKLVMERFTGDVSQWQSFWSQFETAIDKNTSLSKSDKFTYLKSFLSGTAANVVAGLALSDHNYDNAIKMLTSRFGRKDLIINAHMNKLLNLTPVKKATDVNALRKLYDDIEIQVRSLDSMGVVSNTYGNLLCPILMKMIPEEIALAFTRQTGGDDEEGEETDNAFSVKNLMSFVQKEVESRERTANLVQRAQDPPERELNRERSWEKRTEKRKAYSGASYSGASSTAAFHASFRDDSRCVFCNGNDHKSKNCTELTVELRREKLRKQGRCFVCLGSRHVARNCRAQNINCEECGRRHHKTVCYQTANQYSAENRRSDVQHGSDRQAENNIPSDAIVASSPSNSEHSTVLLQTATIWIDAPTKSQVARCLLDGGSTRSFIKEDISRALNLPVIGKETLNVYVFGSKMPQRITCRKVKARLY